MDILSRIFLCSIVWNFHSCLFHNFQATDVVWHTVRYSDAKQDLLVSDWERFEAKKKEMDEPVKGKSWTTRNPFKVGVQQ